MMKHWLIGILLLVSLVACNEDEECEPEPSPYYGTASLLMNGRAWDFGAVAGNSGCNSENLSLRNVYYDESGLERMAVVIGNFSPQVGRYVLRNEEDLNECALNLTYGSASTLEGDVLVERFHIVEDAGPNELIITHYDSAAHRLEGRFQMTLAVKDLFRVDSIEFPDTLHITYGTFSTEIVPPEND